MICSGAFSAAPAGMAPAEDRREASRSRSPLTIDARGAVRVAVAVNDSGPFTFVLDTGASRTIIDDDLARQLAAPVVARTEVVTSGGTDARPVVRLRSVNIGTALQEHLLAPVVPAERLAPLGRNVRGILGQDFLSAHNYTLDYRRRRIAWDEPVACGGSDAAALIASEGRFIVRVDDEESGTSLRLVPDSGAEAVILFRARGTRERAGVMAVGVAGNGRIAERRTLKRLRVGTVTFRDVDAFAIDRDEPEVDGLLPLHHFASVSFAAGGACMIAR
jgi:predicted aspartyl protease